MYTYITYINVLTYQTDDNNNCDFTYFNSHISHILINTINIIKK